MIDIKNVTFKYASAEESVLNNINLHIDEGEFVLLLGGSGCGKTTITRLINGLAPDFYEGELSGDVIVANMNTKEHTIQDLAHVVGSVFQDPRSQFFAMDTTAEIAFSCENAGFAREKTISRIINVAEQLQIKELLGKSVFELSSGEKQMIAIASVYAREPQVMVFDEPSANLDHSSIEKLKHNMSVLKQNGHTIVVAEHRIHYLKELYDKVVIIRNGKVEEVLSADEFNMMSNTELNKKGLRSTHIDQLVNKDAILNKKKPFLKLENIAYHYNKNRAVLKNTNLEVMKGEILGIIGQNGTGKTTLLEIICGIRKQQGGVISIDGKVSKAKQRIEKTYFVMQDSDYQLFTESVEKEIYLGSKKTQDSKEKGKIVLQQMNLSNYLHRHPASLSGGQKQRLCIAVSYMKDTDIICFDEPTCGLDYNSMKQVTYLLKELAQKGKAIIVTTHDKEFMSLCCTSVYEMERPVQP